MTNKLSIRLGLALTICMGGCAQSPIAARKSAPTPAELFSTQKNTAPEVRGVWQSDSYGWILEIDEHGAKLYDISTTNCTKATAVLKSYETYFHAYTLNDSKLELSGYFYPYRYEFERIEKTPLRCITPPPPTPRRTFDFFVETMFDHYAFFEERGVDWNEIVDVNRPTILDTITDDELWTVLRLMLRPIDDGHITLRDPGERSYFPGRGPTMMSILPLARIQDESPQVLYEKWYEDYFVQIEQKLLENRARKRGNDRIMFGLIGGDIGYINIRSMGGYTKDLSWSAAGFKAELTILNAALDEAIALFENTDGVIIDVADNSGGFGMFSDMIASRFIARTLRGNYRMPVSERRLIQREPQIKPSTNSRYEGPVIVVGSNLTVSAGESFLMSIRQAENVRIAGEPTRGALSEVMTKTLPNGWELDLSNEHYLDADRRLWEVKGVQPDIPLQIFNPVNIFDGHTDAILKLAAKLRTD